MTGNSTNGDKSMNCGKSVKSERKENVCSDIIPTNWKKFGEVYCDELKQSVFVCLICIEKAESIDTAFTTYDGSSFWSHLQEHYISVDCELIGEIPVKKQHIKTEDVQCSQNKDESTKLPNVKTNTNQINTSSAIHDGTNETNELYQLDIKVEPDLDPLEQSLPNTYHNDDKFEQMPMDTFSNSNYYYDDQTYTISDEEEEDDDDDEEENYGDQDLLRTVDERNYTDYIEHNDTIEISDDEDDQYKNNTHRTSTMFSNAHLRISGDFDLYENKSLEDEADFYKCMKCSLTFGDRIDLLKHMRSHDIEENILSLSSANRINGIPTPDVSPCDSKAKRNNRKLNRYQCNYYAESFYEGTLKNQRQGNSEKGTKPLRPFRSFQCKICGKRTASEETMQIHQKRFHNCTTQTNRLKPVTNQGISERFHKIERPDQSLRENSSLRGVKGQLLIRPFKCKICNKRTGTEQAMRVHQQRFHSPASLLTTTECEICHKRIFTPKLQQHMIVHNAPKYKCDDCGLIYKHKQSLTTHIKKFHANISASVNSEPIYQYQFGNNINNSRRSVTHSNEYRKKQSSVMTCAGNSDQAKLTPQEDQLVVYSLR